MKSLVVSFTSLKPTDIIQEYNIEDKLTSMPVSVNDFLYSLKYFQINLLDYLRDKNNLVYTIKDNTIYNVVM